MNGENEKFYKEQTFKMIDERFNSVEKKIDIILENHLPHIEKRIDKLASRIAYFTGGVSVLFVLIQLIIKFWPK